MKKIIALVISVILVMTMASGCETKKVERTFTHYSGCGNPEHTQEYVEKISKRFFGGDFDDMLELLPDCFYVNVTVK